MRLSSTIGSILSAVLVLAASAPAGAGIVTLWGLGSCPAPGTLVSGPGRAVLARGANATDSTALACFQDSYVAGQPRLMGETAFWQDVCLPLVNCSAGNVVTQCVVCSYPDPSLMAAPGMSLFGVVLLVSALIGVAYRRGRARDAMRAADTGATGG